MIGVPMLKNLLARSLDQETAAKMDEFLKFAVPSCEETYKSTDRVYHFWSTYHPGLPLHGRNGLRKRIIRELRLRGVPVKSVEDTVDGDESEYWSVIEVHFVR
jgi:hypothetical protein